MALETSARWEQCDQMLKDEVVQNYPKIAQKVTITVKMDEFKRAQTVNIHLGYFCKKSCHQKLKKIAQSRHTGLEIKRCFM